MRLTSVALILTTVALSAVQAHVASGQDVLEQRVSLQVRNQSLPEVFKDLQQLADVHFMYKSSDIDKDKRVTLAVENEELKDVLARLLKPAGLGYTAVGRNIVIRQLPRPAPAPVPPAAPVKTQVSGTVTTSDTGDPLPGVNVLLKGTTIGTTTDFNGQYAIEAADESSVLVFSFIGFKTAEVVVGTQTTIDVPLEQDALQLQDIVVVGYGTSEKEMVTGAVTNARLDKLESKSFSQTSEALQGMVPGVTVQNNGGDPTSTPSIKIRGFGGINSDAPLWVVDGIIYEYGVGAQLNPNDIESISVLKDAAAAVYGARASGGVIIVTTKKGKDGKLSLTADAKVGFQKAWNVLQPLNAAEFAEVSNIAADNAGLARKDVFDAGVYPDGQITRTNWMDEIFQTGKISDYNVSLSGGNEKTNFYLSMGYRNNEGILLNTNIERYSLRINSSYQVKDWLTLGENISLSYTNGQGANTSSPYTGAIISAIYYPPNVSVYNDAGEFSGLPDEYAGSYGDVINPVAYLKRLDISTPYTWMVINPYAEVTLLKGLKFRTNLGITRVTNMRKEFNVRVLETGKKFFNNTLTMSGGVDNTVLAEQTLSYEKTFGDVHNFDITAGYMYQLRSDEYFSVWGQDFEREDDEFRYFDNFENTGNNFSVNGTRQKESLISYLGRVNYSYKDKYLLTGIVRRDGSSLIPTGNRWQVYPSISAGWRIGEEDFFNADWIDNLKLRASWGRVGNLGSLPYNAFNVSLSRTQALIGDDPTWVTGYAISGIPNPSLQWSFNDMTNFGVDASFLGQRISLEADYFLKKTHDMIMQLPVPSTAGVNSGPWVNLQGTSLDKGWEFGLTFRSEQGSALGYTINTTFTRVKNKVESLDDGLGLESIPAGPTVRSTLTPGRIAEGQPLYSYYVVKTDGIFQSEEEINAYINDEGELIQPNAQPGDLKFIDNNDNGEIDPGDRVYAGSALPKFSYGVSANFNYRNFDLNIFLQGVYGNKLFNGLKYTGLNAGIQGYNMLRDIKGAWSPENTGSDIPRISADDPNSNFGTTSDWYLESGSYARLKNLTLGYTLPEGMVSRAGLQSVRVYFTGQNLLTFTDYSGFDPEVGLGNGRPNESQSGTYFGVDTGQYPQARTFLLGVTVGL